MTRAGLLASAVRRIRPVVLLWLVLGNALSAALATLWLLIPDSHKWQLALSFLLALAITAGVLLCDAAGLRALRTEAPRLQLWKAALLIGAIVAVAIGLNYLLALAVPGIELRAGLWNSRLSAGLRHVLTYQRLIDLQHAALAAIRWVILPGLLTPFALECAGYGARDGSMRRALTVLGSPRHWAVAAVALGIAAWAVPTLVDWHPGHSVSAEVVSAALRLGFAFLIGGFAALLLLACDSELLARVAARDAHTPDASDKQAAVPSAPAATE